MPEELLIALLTIKAHDVHKVCKVKNYIITMALNHDASLLAIAFGRRIAILSDWLSGSAHYFAKFPGFDILLDFEKTSQLQVSYLSTKGVVPKTSLGLPQNMHFIDKDTLLVFFLHQVMYAYMLSLFGEFMLTFSAKFLLRTSPFFCKMESSSRRRGLVVSTHVMSLATF